MYKYLAVILLFVGTAHAAILVKWEPVDHSDLAGYVVFRATPHPSNGWTQISSETELVTDLFFLDEGAVGFYSFWYMVIAVNQPGDVLEESIPECVIHYCHGDADLSGVVDIADAVLIEQHAVGMVDLCEDLHVCRAADANLDGWVDIADSVLVKRFIVELDAQEAHCLVAQ
ncbi:MAG: hypothetical protein ACXABY_19030 [Candidatus Thorarchaeota archaeon]|jgi:hypothetical protein